MENNGTNFWNNIISTIILGVIIFFVLAGCDSQSSKENISEEYTPEQKQNIMKITNDFANEGLQKGLIKKIEKNDYNNDCIYTFWVEEISWNTMPYESKQDMHELIRHYSKVRGCNTGSLRGYRNGKFL